MSDYNAAILFGLKRALKENLMSLKRLSSLTRIPYRSLQNYLGGVSRMPADVYVKICNTLGVDNQYILKKNFRPQHDILYEAMFFEVAELFYGNREAEIFRDIEDFDVDAKKQVLADYLAARVGGSYDVIVRERFKKGWRGSLPLSDQTDEEEALDGDGSQ